MIKDLIRAVRKHANENIESGGWDYVVEAMTVEEIEEIVAGSKDAEEAIQRVQEMVSCWDSRRSDIEGTIF